MSKKFSFHTLLFALCCLMMLAGTVNPAFSQAALTVNLQNAIQDAAEKELIPVNIRLSEQYDSVSLFETTRQMQDREQRRAFVVSELKNFSKTRQSDLLDYLHDKKNKGQVKDIRPLWIGNLISCRVTADVIRQLATRKDIARLDYNVRRQVLLSQPVETLPVAARDKIRTPQLAWNVSLVNADQVWDQGYTGEDVVVAVLDTGVNYDHHDIQDNMWEHPDYPNHGYNFVDDDHNTMDYQGHGTHCAGTVAGTGASGTATGIAPGATIMALQVLDDDGGGNEADVWAGIQFAVEYGADIMSLSLGWRHGWDPDRAMWRTAMDHALSAGVVASAAAGNIPWIGGQPPPNEIHTPGDVPPPWLHPDQTLEGGISAVVSVGATTDTDQLADFSCKGPVTWQDVDFFNDYPYDPGMGLIRPDLVAPGANVTSLLHSDNTGYTNKSGTSMATPAVAGAMALMLQKNPDLLPEHLSQTLEETAFATFTGKNNEYGSGRLDALEAINQTPNMFIRYVEHQIDDSLGNDNGQVNPGETIMLDITLENRTIHQIDDAEAVLTSMSPYVTITDSTATLGDFEPGETLTFEQAFTFEVAENIPGNYFIHFKIHCHSDADPTDVWTSTFSEMAHAPYLEFANLEVVHPSTRHDFPSLVFPRGETVLLQADLKNTGQMGISDIHSMISSGDPWLTILAHEAIQVDTLPPGANETLAFEVAALAEVPQGTESSLDFHAFTDVYAFDQTESLLIGHPPTYTQGDIPSTYKVMVTTESEALEPGQITVNVPDNSQITGVDVYYEMTSQNGALVSVQRSFLKCVSEGGATEEEVHVVDVDTAGTVQYARHDLDIANNVTAGGDIAFELHAFRTWGGSGSNTNFVYVPDNTWRVVVHYELPLYEILFLATNQVEEVVEGAVIETRGQSKETGPDGQVYFDLPKGTMLYSANAEKHKPLSNEVYEVSSPQDIIPIMLTRVFEVHFAITDVYGNDVPDATITLNGETLDPGQHTADGLEDGTYHYIVDADGYHPYDGDFEIVDDDVDVDVVLQPDGTGSKQLSDLDVRLYPNPAAENIHIEIPAGDIRIKSIDLLNNTGGVVKNISINKSHTSINKNINLQNLAPGLYFIKVQTNVGTYPFTFIKH